MTQRSWLALLSALLLVLASTLPIAAVRAEPTVQVVLDGRTLTLDPPPIITESRTLVPLRGLFEAMGATVEWNAEQRAVTAHRADRYVRLKIDRRLACLDQPCYTAAMLDVPARIIQERTFVPLRFVATAMGAQVSWDQEQRAVIIDTSKPPVAQPSSITIPTLVPGQFISDPQPLHVAGATGSAVQFYLIDPASQKASIIAAGSDTAATYTWTPDTAQTGIRLVVAGVQESSGALRYSDPITVLVLPNTAVALTGVEAGSVVRNPVKLGARVGFAATQVDFVLTDTTTKSTEHLGTVGPGESITWYPQIGHKGAKQLRAIAHDRLGSAYESVPVSFTVDSGYRQVAGPIEEGDTFTRPITLWVEANYTIDSVQYILDGKTLGWGLSHYWSFGPEANGAHTMLIKITAADGTVNTIGPVSFNINFQPRLRLSGVGPDQVVTEPVTLQISSNVKLKAVEYQLLDASGKVQEVLGRTGVDETLSWALTEKYAGTQRLRAIGIDETGKSIMSDTISFRVYLGKTYGPQPVAPRNQFKGLATRLAVKTYLETGMSAALQVAQAILETGWGQSVPVDKYTGLFSQNLFGIKGEGPAGSVISNTWEEYNGVSYRVDDAFRAYHSVEESWNDHQQLLLTKNWYAPFQAVVANPILGAWALYDSGYATDSAYPLKLIEIMQENDLFALDQFEL